MKRSYANLWGNWCLYWLGVGSSSLPVKFLEWCGYSGWDCACFLSYVLAVSSMQIPGIDSNDKFRFSQIYKLEFKRRDVLWDSGFLCSPWIYLFHLQWSVLGKYFLKNAPKEINAAFGYRTSMSMKNRDTWVFAHNYCGKIWFFGGLILLPVSTIVMYWLLEGQRIWSEMLEQYSAVCKWFI